MAVPLKDEHERYTEFLDELRSITDENEQKERALLQSDEIINAYKSDVSMTNMKSFLAGAECDTPEEEEVLRVCMNNTKQRMMQYAGFGCAFTTAISLVNYDRLPMRFKAFGLFTGALAGSFYGIVTSTQNTLKMFESLGPEYQLGRLAHEELEEWQTGNKEPSS